MDENLNEANGKAVMNQNMTDRSVSAIENSIGSLTHRQMQIEANIADLQEEHRHTMRSLAAFRLALRMLQP